MASDTTAVSTGSNFVGDQRTSNYVCGGVSHAYNQSVVQHQALQIKFNWR